MLDAAMPPGGAISAVVPLAAELCDLKRVRDARSRWSAGAILFRQAWGTLASGQDAETVALCATAEALAACRLGRIDFDLLAGLRLPPSEVSAIRKRSFDEIAGALDPALAALLRETLDDGLRGGRSPSFVRKLMRQPRAGATCPGKPRIVLEPPETHAEHCLVVAVLAVALAPMFRARPGVVFLAGMAHHLHNAELPDSGFAGEMLLGEQLAPVMRRLFARELATLPQPLRSETEAALATIRDASTAEGQAFHAADVIDRVLQMRHYDQVARFTVDQALDDMDLVHAGPVQAFHQSVLRDAGLP